MTARFPRLVLSGGQTGADFAGWNAARAFGIPTGGWMAQGFLTERGLRPQYAELYGAKECDSPDYPARRLLNVRDSDGTVCFNSGDVYSKGTKGVWKDCKTKLHRPLFIVCILPNRKSRFSPSDVARWVEKHQIETLNIAGNRASTAPWIYDWVFRFLSEMFRQLGFEPEEQPLA